MSLVNHPLTTPKVKFLKDHGLNDKLYNSMIEECKYMGSIPEISTRLIACLGWRVCLGFVQVICSDINTKHSLQIKEVIKNSVTTSYASYSDSLLSLVEKHKWIKAPHLIEWDKKYLKAYSVGQEEKEKERIRVEKEVAAWNAKQGVA